MYLPIIIICFVFDIEFFANLRAIGIDISMLANLKVHIKINKKRDFSIGTTFVDLNPQNHDAYLILAPNVCVCVYVHAFM